jgi:hypothetical protein
LPPPLLLLLLLGGLLPLMWADAQQHSHGYGVGRHPLPQRGLLAAAVCARCLCCCLCWGASRLQKLLRVLLWLKGRLHLAASPARAAAGSEAALAPTPSAGKIVATAPAGPVSTPHPACILYAISTRKHLLKSIRSVLYAWHAPAVL